VARSRGAAGQYHEGDELVFPAWNPSTGMPGTATGSVLRRRRWQLEYSLGEALWAETAAGLAAAFDATDDLLLGTAPAVGTPVSRWACSGSDANGNGAYDRPESVWTKARYSRFTTSARDLFQVTVDLWPG